jgi:hypothetical protein
MVKIVPDQKTAEMLGDVFVSLEAFKNSRGFLFLTQAKELLDVLYKRCEAEVTSGSPIKLG